MSPAVTKPDGPMRDKKLREAVIAGCRELLQRRLASGTSGNVSLRRDERCFFLSPTGMPYEALEPEDITLVDADGNWFGRRRPSSEWRFHRDIFKAREEVVAIVHTHSPKATSTQRGPSPTSSIAISDASATKRQRAAQTLR